MTKMTFSLFANKAQFRPFWQKNSKVAIFVMYFIQHRFIFRHSGSTVSHDAEIALWHYENFTIVFSRKFSRHKNVHDNCSTFLKITELFLFFSRKIFMKDIKSFTKASKLWRWVAQSGRWVAKSGRWVAKLVARMLIWQLSGFESRHLSKILNGRHNQRSGQHTLAHKKIKKLLSCLACLILLPELSQNKSFREDFR